MVCGLWLERARKKKTVASYIQKFREELGVELKLLYSGMSIKGSPWGV